MSVVSISRREFLKAAMIGAGVLAARSSSLIAQSSSTQRILIIGAGISGLATASFLRKAGYQDVTVIEGRDRIGGRTWTSHAWQDIPLDLGASWIHGTNNNPIWDLAQSAGLQTVETNEDQSVTYQADGSVLNDADVQALQDQGESILEQTQSMSAGTDYPLQQAVDAVIKDENLTDAEKQDLDYWFGTTIGHEYAAELYELSALSWADDKELGGAQVIFAKGYEQIVNLLAKDVHIELSHIVQEIHVENDAVRVVTNKATFTADYCVVTLPLGVLKKGTVSFTPPLQDDKQQAIDHLGMGLLNKLYLRFPSVFWDKDAGWLEYIAPEKSQWMEWLNLDFYLGVPILLGFNAGDYGRQIESLSDQQIVTRAMQTLHRLYGTDIPAPIAFQVTRWASDPFCFGSYSYNGVGSNADSRDILAEPIENRLFFAGEATASDFPATVHGAYLSGMRAAQAIAAL